MSRRIMPEPIDVQALAAALGRIPSGLFILTAQNGEYETGMLASWVQQCSFDPPRVSVCIRNDRELTKWLESGNRFTLNCLGENQTNLISHFGKGFALDQPAFTGLSVQRAEGEAPILSDALGYLLCRVAGRASGGDHDLFIGDVVGGKVNNSEIRPWVHIRKNGLKY